MGECLLEKARELRDKPPRIEDVRGLGLFVGLELVKKRKTREPILPIAAKVLPGANPKLEVGKKPAEMGLMAMTANPRNVIGLSPPLIITRDEIDEGMAIVDKALVAADAFAEYADINSTRRSSGWVGKFKIDFGALPELKRSYSELEKVLNV
jgi:taurine---2-oxoglutarate transaminase